MAGLLAAPNASAFGGYFEQTGALQAPVGGVAQDRVAFAVTPGQTIMWDEMRFSGNPSEFAWVLPVRPGAQVALASDAWFAALDEDTEPLVFAPEQECDNSSGSSQSSAAESAGCFGPSPSEQPTTPILITYPDAGGDSIKVVSEQVVGPYEAVTLRASGGASIGDWLRTNGYPVGASAETTLDAYTSAGFDFLALRIRPNAGAQATQPIRITTPGSDTTLPLRMLAVAAEAQVAIQLFVISTSAYGPSNFPTTTLDGNTLVWDYGKQQSNYEALVQGILSAGAGTTWLVEASRADLPPGDAGTGTNLGFLYAQLCQAQTAPRCAPEADAEAADAEAADASTDACLPASACDDFSVATANLSGPLWVTRLRADLPPGALVTDLALTVTQGQGTVSPDFRAYHMTDPYSLCPSPNPGPADCSSLPRTPSRRAPVGLVILATLSACGLLRRRARKG